MTLTKNVKCCIYNILTFTLILTFTSCDQESKSVNNETSSYSFSALDLHNLNIALEKDIVHDFFSPPVASRIYLYPNLVSYEIMSQKDSNYNSLTSIFIDFPQFPEYKLKQGRELAASYAFLQIAHSLVYTTKNIDSEILKLDGLLKSYPNSESIKKYSDEVVAAMLPWIKNDNYNKTRNMGDYQLLEEPNKWKPTAPDFLDALEPHWSKIRPMTLDSAAQFSPPTPVPYDLTEGSQFYIDLMEVYSKETSKTDSTKAIAKFWDCNPIILRHEGHITYSEKKLTPGGHWMNIYRAVAIKENQNFMETSYVYASLSIAMFDAFISCWEAKYAYNYIRPITVIHNNIDPNWDPMLYTPNFPEYPSGHSVVSRSASTLLTHFFGDNYAFVDSTETPFGMPSREFKSFNHASDEAAISRLYGGIHFKPAIYYGIEQGEKIGNNVITEIEKLRK